MNKESQSEGYLYTKGVRQMIHQEVNRIYRQLPLDNDEKKDLVGYAYVGFCEARNRFRPELGVPFTAFSRRRVRGAIIDGLRQGQGPLKRRAYERFCTDGPLSLRGYLREKHFEASRMIECGSVHIAADQLLEQQQALVGLRQALKQLPEAESRLICSLYGIDQAPLSGEVLARRAGCHRSSVQRRKVNILAKLRTWLSLEIEGTKTEPPSRPKKRIARRRSAAKPNRSRCKLRAVSSQYQREPNT